MIISPDDYIYTTDSATGKTKYVWTPNRAKTAWATTFAKVTAALKNPKYTKLVLLIGIPASGKSTWLQTNQESDAIYIDATFAQKQWRKKPIELAKAAGKRVEAVVMDTPIAVCLDRNKCRTPDRRVPEDVVVNMAINLTQEMPTVAEGFDAIIKVQDKNNRGKRLHKDAKQKIPGGLGAKKKPGDFDPKQLSMGVKVEREHTDDPALAQEIAMDHLTEDPAYYTHLKAMEEKHKTATQVGTDTGTIYAISPEQLHKMMKTRRWEAAADLVYRNAPDPSAGVDGMDAYEQMGLLVRQHGGAVFHTNTDGFHDVDVRAAVDGAGPLPPYGTLEYEWQKLADATFELKGMVGLVSPKINAEVAEAQKELINLLGKDYAGELIRAKNSRDGHSSHITVFSPKETNQIIDGIVADLMKKEEGLSKSKAKDMAKDELKGRLQRATTHGDWKSLGIGKAESGGKEAYFLVIDWPGGKALRKDFGLAPGGQDFHVTIGFLGGDVFGVPKDKRALIKTARRTAAWTLRTANRDEEMEILFEMDDDDDLDDDDVIEFEPDGNWLNP